MTFNEVYDRFRRPVWRLARRLTENDEEALDATQEIFLRVWRGLEGFRGEAKLSTWVFQIAWNYLRAYRRRQGRQLQLVSEGTASSEELVAIVEAAVGREGTVYTLARITKNGHTRTDLISIPGPFKSK